MNSSIYIYTLIYVYKTHIKWRSCRFWRKFIRLSGGLTCWMWKKPIGRDENRFSRVWVLYRDWLYRKKISKKFWMAKMGGGCWRYRRPIVMDDTREGLVCVRYRSWLYLEAIWTRKMREKSSKKLDFACLGRSTDRFGWKLTWWQDFVYRFGILAQKNRFPG